MTPRSRFRTWMRENDDVVLLINLVSAFSGSGLLTWTAQRFLSVNSWLFWLSFFGLFAALLLLVVRVLLVAGGVATSSQAAPVEQSAPPEASPESTPAPKEEDEYTKKLRVGVHEAITTLEHHQGTLRDWETRSHTFNPGYQGEWPKTRLLLAEDWRNDQVVRATERAFQQIGHVSQYQEQDDRKQRVRALRWIREAIEELDLFLHRQGGGS